MDKNESKTKAIIVLRLCGSIDIKDMEENFVITKAEADHISQKTLVDPNNKTYDNLDEFFKDLDHEIKKI